VLNGTFSAARSHFQTNSAFEGGALYSQTALTDSVVLRDVTFAGNVATQKGGAIFTSGDLFLTNGTLSGNRAGGLGGALYSSGKASLKFVTIVATTSLAGALYGDDANRPAPVYASALLLAVNNTGGSCGGVIVSVGNGNNVSDSMSCGGVFAQSNDKNNVNAALGPLQDNGGGAATHLLLAGNVALDLIAPADCLMQDGSPPADQRSVARPQNTRCDAGAVEARAIEGQRSIWMPIAIRGL
jgi:predicted outer membrane repeat protein